jgi:SAM-dependent methyltransferase
MHHVYRYITARAVAGGRVLDAACGCGYGSGLLHSKTGSVVGLDIHQMTIDWAKTYFPGPEYICGRIEDAPWSGKFETVVSLETLEHMKEPEKALKAFRASCDGLLIASVPNEEEYPFDPEKFIGDEYPHQRHYTPAEFESLLNSCGWNVVVKTSQNSKTDSEPRQGTAGMFLTYISEAV